MSLSKQILAGLAGGIAVGLFLGEKASFLHWPARGFVQLLQVTVLPYIVGSLVHGIAGGSAGQARRLASRGGLVIGLLWILALALVFLSPLALPAEKGGSYFASQAAHETAPIDWLDLYIPANPFRSLANNVVPAVVVFSILLGVALIGVPGKERILAPLQIANEALGRAGSLLVRLTPVGLFAIAGHAAGTLRLEEFERLQAFFLLYVGLSLLLTLVLVPALVSALTGIRYRSILKEAQDPLLTAFFTASLFIVLPLLAERGRRLLAESDVGAEEAGEAVAVLVPTSFTFPHAAKVLSLTFLVFAGWFAGAPLAPAEYPTLAGAGLLSLFGSLNVAMPFLLDLARLPADLFQLFVVSSVVNSYFGSAAAVMHTLAVALVGARLMTGRLRVGKARLAGLALAGVVSLGVFLAGSHALLAWALPTPESGRAAFDRLRLSGSWGNLARASFVSAPPSAAGEGRPARGRRLEQVLARGSLRFGVTEDELPWSFRNGRGEIVGIEADIAHALAFDLGLRLELVPVGRDLRRQALERGDCDVAAGRVKAERAAAMLFTRPVAEERWAFLVADHERAEFARLERLREWNGLRLAVLPVHEWVERLKRLLPAAEIVEVGSILEYVEAPAGRFDGMFTGFERAAAYSLLHPRLAVVTPADLGGIPLGLVVPAGETELLALVDSWLDGARASGLVQAKLGYWAAGEGARLERGARWSVGRDVLGWWR